MVEKEYINTLCITRPQNANGQVAPAPGKHQPAMPAGEAEAGQRTGRQAGQRSAGGTPGHDPRAANEAARAREQAHKSAGKHQEKILAKSTGTVETAKMFSLYNACKTPNQSAQPGPQRSPQRRQETGEAGTARPKTSHAEGGAADGRA